MINSKKIAFSMAAVALSSVLNAAQTSSLVAVEGGYSSVASEVTDSSVTPNTYAQDKSSMGNAGLKIGAEGDNYRVFAGGRYYFAGGEYDSLTSYGVDLQYKFNFFKGFNMFVGGGVGMVNAKFNVPTEAFTRTISDPYYSGDFGVNIHLNENFDLELGAKYMVLNASNVKSDVDYTFNDITTGYTSLIYKFQLD